MADSHMFEPLHPLEEAVTAGCSCGWVSAYSHAFEKYAEADFDFHATLHVATEEPTDG